MRPSSIPAAAFMPPLLLIISFACTRGGAMQPHLTTDDDRRAIEALNEHDVKAALASDVEAIVSQWTEDFVVLPPAGPIVRGRAANAAAAEQGRELLQALVAVDYNVDFEEITVTGDYAFAWGTYRSTVRPRAGGADVTSSGKLMRILQKQPDGAWKMHRTMMTADPQAR
jgi:uncharacterized protein (TIGR02246 family)